jgi:hypothetical protein
MTARVTLPEPVIVSRFWKNRHHDAIVVELATYEGRNVCDVRMHAMHEGRLLPTKKGISVVVLRLPDLHRAISKALKQAKELGLPPPDDGERRMRDISLFRKILQQPDAPLPAYVQPRFVWICASRSQGQTGQFYYRVGGGKHPLSKLFTCSLADAAAEWFGLPVKEYGPPEAFGRKPKSTPLPAATVDELWRLVEANDADRLKVWLRERPKDVPALFELLETAFPKWGASP